MHTNTQAHNGGGKHARREAWFAYGGIEGNTLEQLNRHLHTNTHKCREAVTVGGGVRGLAHAYLGLWAHGAT